VRGALIRAAPARIVVVASDAHRRATMKWDDLMNERGRYRGFRAYSESKLANVLFTRELARRIARESPAVTANALHPGLVASNFGRDNPPLVKLVMPIVMLFGIDEAKGAKTSLHLATSPDVEHVTGRYFYKCREATPSAAAQNDEDARRLWQASLDLLAGAGFP